VALLRKMTCNLRHPTGLRHTVHVVGKLRHSHGERHVTCKHVMSRMKESAIYEWVMSHINESWVESCHTHELNHECNTLQHTATLCNTVTLQRTACHVSHLQRTACHVSHIWLESHHTYELSHVTDHTDELRNVTYHIHKLRSVCVEDLNLFTAYCIWSVI